MRVWPWGKRVVGVYEFHSEWLGSSQDSDSGLTTYEYKILEAVGDGSSIWVPEMHRQIMDWILDSQFRRGSTLAIVSILQSEQVGGRSLSISIWMLNNQIKELNKLWLM